MFVRRDGAADPASASKTSAPSRPGELVLTLHGESLKVTPEDFGTNWPFEGEVPDRADALEAWAAAQSDELGAMVSALIAQGHAFQTLTKNRLGDWHRISGQPLGLQVQFEIAPASGLEADLVEQIAAQKLKLAEADAMIERGAAHPVAAFEISDEGDVVWSNRAARQILDIGRGHRSLRAVPPEPSDEIVPLQSANGRQLGSARVQAVTLSTGHRLISVQDAATELRARDSLKTFTATLTETFAHLDVALAIFDAGGRLSLFNPAVSELLGIGPAQLALRPGFHEFLDLLRGQQMVPEHRSFTIWRKSTIDKLKAVREEPYLQTWMLPDGHALQVSSRPHPGGGIAVIFKDMSQQVQIERKYVSELETSHAVLDALAHEIAIIGLSGEVHYANAIFAARCALPNRPVDMDTLSLGQILERFGALAPGQASGDRIRDFVLGERTENTEKITFGTASSEAVLLSALPDGSTLIQIGPADTLHVAEIPASETALLSATDTVARAIAEG